MTGTSPKTSVTAPAFALTLVRGQSDPPMFSSEYQAELREMSRIAKPASQRAFTMDSVGCGGGALGEFLFTHGEALLTAVIAIGARWVEGRMGRKVRVKMGDVEIEAASRADVEQLLIRCRELQNSAKAWEDTPPLE